MGSIKFTFECGALLRTQVVAEIKNGAFMQGLTTSIEEDRGLLESNYRVLIEGPDDKIVVFKLALDNWLKKIQTE